MTENVDARIPWLFRPPRSILPWGQTIDHRSWRGDDWQYTTVVDFDGDGRKDILFGDYWGHVWFHKGLRKDGEDAFDTQGVRIVTENGSLVEVGPTGPKAYDFDSMQGPRTGVVAADFDGDGGIDLVVSDVYGHFYFCPRGSHAAAPKVKSQILFGELKRFGSMSVVDWDGDGRPDLLVSQSDVHTLYRNVGAGHGIAGTPFGPPQKLDLPPVPVIGSVTRVFLLDVNRDGDRDLILSSDHGYDCFFEDSFLRRGYAPGRLVRFEKRPHPLTH